MKKRYLDGIYCKKTEKPQEIPLKIITSEPKPTPPKPAYVKPPLPQPPPLAPSRVEGPPPSKRSFFWFILGGVFLILLFLATFFWLGLLGPEAAFLRILTGLNGKYLVLFQNNAELRPTGGFLGSFAEAELKNGLLKNYDFETNIWKRDKAFVEKVCLPLPKPFVEKFGEGHCFALRDANWSPDFQDAAETVKSFYKQEGGNKVDGVIALDATFFTELLKLTGPIEMPKYNKTLTSENFVKETQYYVEKEYFENPENQKDNEPKTILKEMLPKVLAKLKNPRLIYPLLKVIKEALSQKHLLFSFNDSGLLKIAQRYHFTGEIKNTTGDYLYINNANLGGKKSSLNILEEISLDVKIQTDGSYLNTLTIKRTHRGSGAWPDDVNHNYTRVLIPKGSLLKDKIGIEKIDYSEEFDKVVFGFWTTVAPKESKTFSISYILPFKKSDHYFLLVQKQPGTISDKLNFNLDGLQNTSWRYIADLDTDKSLKIDLTPLR